MFVFLSNIQISKKMMKGEFPEPGDRLRHQSDKQNNLFKLENWDTYIMECRNAAQDLITKGFQWPVTCEIGHGCGFEKTLQKDTWLGKKRKFSLRKKTQKMLYNCSYWSMIWRSD